MTVSAHVTGYTYPLITKIYLHSIQSTVYRIHFLKMLNILQTYHTHTGTMWAMTYMYVNTDYRALRMCHQVVRYVCMCTSRSELAHRAKSCRWLINRYNHTKWRDDEEVEGESAFNLQIPETLWPSRHKHYQHTIWACNMGVVMSITCVLVVIMLFRM